MIAFSQRRFFPMACSLIIALAIIASPVAVCAAESPQKPIAVGPDDEIYGSQEAADLVAQARNYDPMYCPREQADRDRAARLYEQAMAAQPGASINAPLADRLAQLYAFYEDKQKKVSPARSKASQWWGRCLELTTSKQLLWAQAQMGLASMAVIDGDHKSAVARYDKILEMDVGQIELPDWKTWPDSASDQGKAVLDQAKARLRQSIGAIQARAAEKEFYVLRHVSNAAALDALQSIAAKHKGTPAGDRASNMIDCTAPK